MTAEGAGTVDIDGVAHLCEETPCKRRIDVRRWEVRSSGWSSPYVVTFQRYDGSEAACSCDDGIFRRRCRHIDALRLHMRTHPSPSVQLEASVQAPEPKATANVVRFVEQRSSRVEPRRPVECTVEDVDLEGEEGQIIPGVLVTCGRCKYSVEVFGQEARSHRRGFIMLREDCPMRQSNYYVDWSKDY
jgi:hypothetical protein